MLIHLVSNQSAETSLFTYILMDVDTQDRIGHVCVSFFKEPHPLFLDPRPLLEIHKYNLQPPLMKSYSERFPRPQATIGNRRVHPFPPSIRENVLENSKNSNFLHT